MQCDDAYAFLIIHVPPLHYWYWHRKGNRHTSTWECGSQQVASSAGPAWPIKGSMCYKQSLKSQSTCCIEIIWYKHFLTDVSYGGMERIQSWKEQKCILRSSYILHLPPCATNITVHGGQLPLQLLWKEKMLRYWDTLRCWDTGIDSVQRRFQTSSSCKCICLDATNW